MSNNKKKISVALAGLGFGEKVHLPALISNKGMTPLALWHPREERLKESCEKHGLKGYQDWSKLIKDPEIDAIILTTPPEPRYELAREALLAGKHLLLEKPVALEATQIADLQRLAMKHHLSVAVDFEYRAVPLFMQAKKILSEAILGDLWLVKLDWLMSSRADETRPWNWYSLAEKGGGVIGALGTHAFDLLHWLIGPTTSLGGQISTSIRQRPSYEDNTLKKVSSEDVALGQLELSSFNQNAIVPAQVTLSAIARNGRGCWLEIYGSKGTLLLGSDNQKDYVHGFGLWISKGGDQLVRVNPDKEFGFSKTWTDGRIAPVSRIQGWWGESIRNNQPMVPGLTEGLASQQVCEKLQESALTGQRQKNQLGSTN